MALRYPRTLKIASAAIFATKRQASITCRADIITPKLDDLSVQILMHLLAKVLSATICLRIATTILSSYVIPKGKVQQLLVVLLAEFVDS